MIEPTEKMMKVIEKSAEDFFSEHLGELDIKFDLRLQKMMLWIPDHQKILDIGCHNGLWGNLLTEVKKAEVIGIDLPKIIEAKKHLYKFTAIAARAEMLPFPDESFDIVFGGEIFVQSFAPEKIISEIVRVLRKDGLMITSYPKDKVISVIYVYRKTNRKYKAIIKKHFKIIDFYEYKQKGSAEGILLLCCKPESKFAYLEDEKLNRLSFVWEEK